MEDGKVSDKAEMRSFVRRMLDEAFQQALQLFQGNPTMLIREYCDTEASKHFVELLFCLDRKDHWGLRAHYSAIMRELKLFHPLVSDVLMVLHKDGSGDDPRALMSALLQVCLTITVVLS